MGFLQRVGIAVDPHSTAVLPRVSGDVAQIADMPADVAQAFGINVDTETVTRREALTIPSVRRGVQVLGGMVSGFPLMSQRIAQGEANRRAQVNPDRTPIRRPLLEQPDKRVTASEWKRRVMEDLIFTPWSWCRKVGTDRDQFPAQLVHLDQRRITFDPVKRVLRYDGDEVPEAELVRFDSPGNGLLYDGAVVLRTALKLEAAVRRFAELDVPLGVLRDEGNGSGSSPSGKTRMTEDDIDALLDRWEAGNKRRRTRWIGRLKYEAVQFDAARIQLAEARQRSDVAIAQLMNLESQQVNAPGESGMTYVNVQATLNAKVEAARPYMRAIAERLSWPDITPMGQQSIFDVSGYLRGTVADAVAVAVQATQGDRPLMAVDEARARFLDLPPLEEPGVAPAAEETVDA